MTTRKSEIVLGVTLRRKRENHTCQVVRGDNEIFIIVNGGWDGSKAISSYEVFRVSEDGKTIERMETNDHIDGEDEE